MEKNTENTKRDSTSKAIAHDVEETDTLYATAFENPPPLFSFSSPKHSKKEVEQDEKEPSQNKETPEISLQAEKVQLKSPDTSSTNQDPPVQNSISPKKEEKEEEIIEASTIDLLFADDAAETPGDEGNEDNGAAGEGNGGNGDDKPVQKKEGNGSKSGVATNNFGMPDVINSKMETSLSSVNIHENSTKAKEVGALAYTQGSDIHFAPGQFKPNTQSGKELIGHELHHVTQQKEGRVQANTEVNGMPVNNSPALEKEADDAGRKYAAGGASQMKKVDSSSNDTSQLKSEVGQLKIKNGPGHVSGITQFSDETSSVQNWLEFWALFNIRFPQEIVRNFGVGEPNVLSQIFTESQRVKLIDFMNSAVIPENLFNGGDEILPLLTAQNRVLLASHILTTGTYTNQSAEDQRVEARNCGHFVSLVNAYAGVGSGNATDIRGNFDHEGNVVLYGGNTSGGSYSSSASEPFLPLERFDDVQPGDWLYITPAGEDPVNHSVIFGSWEGGVRRANSAHPFRLAITYDQARNGVGEGGVRHTSVRLGPNPKASGPYIRGITRIEHPTESRVAREPSDLLPARVNEEASRERNTAGLESINVTRTDAIRHVQIENRRLLTIVGANRSRGDQSSRLSTDQHVLLERANSTSNLERLVHLNERLQRLAAGVAGLEGRSPSQSQYNSQRARGNTTTRAEGGFETSHSTPNGTPYDITHERQTTGNLENVQNPIEGYPVRGRLTRLVSTARREEAREERTQRASQRKLDRTENRHSSEQPIQRAEVPSGVNIHENSSKAKEVGALAYTQGSDIHFAPGQYNPGTQSGKELLGHELHHVKQQSDGRVKANTEVNGMPVNNNAGLEKEADDAGRKFASGDVSQQKSEDAAPVSSPSNTIQKKDNKEEAPKDDGKVVSANVQVINKNESEHVKGDYDKMYALYNDNPQAAHVKPKIPKKLKPTEVGKKDWAINFAVTLTKKMPVWDDLPKMKKKSKDKKNKHQRYYERVVKEWGKFITSLGAHEDKHLEYDQNGFGGLGAKLKGKTLDEAFAEYDTLIADLEKAHNNFHTKDDSHIYELHYLQKEVEKVGQKKSTTSSSPHSPIQRTENPGPNTVETDFAMQFLKKHSVDHTTQEKDHLSSISQMKPFHFQADNESRNDLKDDRANKPGFEVQMKKDADDAGKKFAMGSFTGISIGDKMSPSTDQTIQRKVPEKASIPDSELIEDGKDANLSPEQVESAINFNNKKWKDSLRIQLLTKLRYGPQQEDSKFSDGDVQKVAKMQKGAGTEADGIDGKIGDTTMAIILHTGFKFNHEAEKNDKIELVFYPGTFEDIEMWQKLKAKTDQLHKDDPDYNQYNDLITQPGGLGKLYSKVNGNVVDVIDARGGPPVKLQDGTHSADPTKKGKYTLGKAEAYTTKSWYGSEIPWGSKVTLVGGEIYFEHKDTGKKGFATGPMSNLHSVMKNDDFYQDDGSGTKVLESTYRQNAFGEEAYRVKGSPGFFVHTTENAERKEMVGEDPLLAISHGCIHIKPSDRSLWKNKGYLKKGVKFTVKSYDLKLIPPDMRQKMEGKKQSYEEYEKSGSFQFGIVKMYFSQGKYNESRKVLFSLLTHPETGKKEKSAIYHSIGVTYLKQGEYKKALEYYELAYKISKSNITLIKINECKKHLGITISPKLKSESKSSSPSENQTIQQKAKIPNGVSIHQNSSKASEIGALAYAQGSDIHFAPGQFKPDTQSGQELIGHELAHVQQQKQGRVKPTTQYKGTNINNDSKLEKEADDFGVKFAQSHHDPISENVNQESRKAFSIQKSSALQLKSNHALKEFSIDQVSAEASKRTGVIQKKGPDEDDIDNDQYEDVIEDSEGQQDELDALQDQYD